MEKPGRKSAASLSTVAVVPGQRPEPPTQLTERQKEIWREVVSTKPFDWWKADSLPLLVSYVQAITSRDFVAAQLDRFETLDTDENLRAYRDLSRILDTYVKQIATLATKMRLSQQSRYNERAAAKQDRDTATRKPWEFGKAG